MNGTPLSQGTYTPNIKALPQTVQKLRPMLKVDQTILLSRSQVKVTGQNILYECEALVTRNLHAKYKGSISNGSKVMTNVKVVQPTNKPTNRRQKQYVPAIATGDIKILKIHLYIMG